MTRVFVVQDGDLSSIRPLSYSSMNSQVNMARNVTKQDNKHSKYPQENDAPNLKFFKKTTIYPSRDDNTYSVNTSNRGLISNNLSNNIDYENNHLDESLQLEKTNNEERSRNRAEIFRSLISGSSVDVSWFKGFLYTLGIIIISFPSTFLYTLVPAHDLIRYPEFWYEILFHGTILNTFRSIAFCLPASWFMNIKQMREARTLVTVCMVSNLVNTSWIAVSYYFWTHVLLFQYPIPFIGYGLYGTETLIHITVLFLRYPKRWRQDDVFKRRMKFFVIIIQYIIILDLANTVVTQILKEFQNQYQPIIGLLFPINRELILLIFPRFIGKTANGDDTAADIILNYAVSAQHTIFLCHNLGSFTTNITSWVLMSVDFTLNILLCLQIVWRKKRKREPISTLQHLATYELAEFHAPLAFLLIFVLAYYGPNATLFGNISNNYWGFTPIENIGETIQNMFIFFLVDFSSTVVSAILLKSFCMINLWKVFLVIQKEFGVTFCAILGDFVLLVSILIRFYRIYWKYIMNVLT